MVAAKIATLPNGVKKASPIGEASKTQAEAAEMLNVGKRSVERARTVINDGVPELIEAVEQGEIAVSAAAGNIGGIFGGMMAGNKIIIR